MNRLIFSSFAHAASTGFEERRGEDRRDCRGSFRKVLALAAATLALAHAASAQVQFADPVAFPDVIGGGAISTAAGDLNGSGRPDIVRTRGNGILQVFSLSGSAWAAHNLSPARSGILDRYGGDTAVADIDGDGHLDIVLPESKSGSGAAYVWWYKNPGTGSFAGWSEMNLATWSGATNAPADSVNHMSDIEVADMDGDGLPDVVTRDVSQGVFIHFQNRAVVGGKTQVSWSQKFIEAFPREGLQLGDIDGDGDTDITFNGIWWRNPGGSAARGGASYDITEQYAMTGRSPFAIDSRWYPTSDGGTLQWATKQAVGDVNGDGRLDIVVTNAEVLGSSGNPSGKPLGAVLYLASSNPLADPTSAAYWTAIQLETDGDDLHGVRLGDLDGDGLLDIFMANTDVGTVHRTDGKFEMIAWLNPGDDDWARSTCRQVVYSDMMYSGILVDFDDDGDLDIIGPQEWNSGKFRLFENTVPEPATACLLAAGLIPLLTRARRCMIARR